MKRMKDYYNWRTVEQWKFILDNDELVKKEILGNRISQKELGQVIELLLLDCFPVALICSINNGTKYIWMTSLWSTLFDFFNLNQTIEKDGIIISFEDMTTQEQESIMNAQIYSIWLLEED